MALKALLPALFLGLFFPFGDDPGTNDEPKDTNEKEIVIIEEGNFDNFIGLNLFSEPQSYACSNTSCNGTGYYCEFVMNRDCKFVPVDGGLRCYVSQCDWPTL